MPLMNTASKPACLSFVAKGPPRLESPQPSVNGDLVTIEQRVAPGRKPTSRPAVKPRMLSGPRASTPAA